jgi:hypothetical protein
MFGVYTNKLSNELQINLFILANTYFSAWNFTEIELPIHVHTKKRKAKRKTNIHFPFIFIVNNVVPPNSTSFHILVSHQLLTKNLLLFIFG